MLNQSPASAFRGNERLEIFLCTVKQLLHFSVGGRDSCIKLVCQFQFVKRYGILRIQKGMLSATVLLVLSHSFWKQCSKSGSA